MPDTEPKRLIMPSHDERFQLHRTSLSELQDIIVPDRHVAITFTIKIGTRELDDYAKDGSDLEEAILVVIQENDVDPMLQSVKIVE